MLADLKNIYFKLAATYREKKIKRQKTLVQMKMMAMCVRRVK